MAGRNLDSTSSNTDKSGNGIGRCCQVVGLPETTGAARFQAMVTVGKPRQADDSWQVVPLYLFTVTQSVAFPLTNQYLATYLG
jgi:hypothetical protein